MEFVSTKVELFYTFGDSKEFPTLDPVYEFEPNQPRAILGLARVGEISAQAVVRDY